MPDGIEEQLALDVSEALQSIQQISDALDQVVQTFSVGLASALEQLTSAGQDVQPLAESLDVAGLGTAIDTALAQASTPIPIEADTTGLDAAIAATVDQPQTVPVDADTTAAQDSIDALANVAPVDVPVDADTTAAQASIDALATIQPIQIPVEADTTAAQDQIDALGNSATEAAGTSGGSGGVDGLSRAMEGLATITPVATGETGGLVDSIAGLSPATAAAAGGLVAVGGFIGEVTRLAADAEAQQKRFNEVFGASAQAVQNINVGGLTISLAELGKQSATASTDLQAAASRIGDLGKSSGASAGTIISTTDNLLALGATIAVNNPRLGDAASVTDRLTNALARGGRSAAAFGISLTTKQITDEALAETGKKLVSELTQFEKATAGANLAVQSFNGTLGTEFQQGAQNAQIQLRSLETQLKETLAAIGGPLLAPLTQSLTDLLPVAEQVGVALGKLAADVLPLIADIAPVLTPIAAAIGLVADGLGALGPAGAAVVIGLGILIPDLVVAAAGFASAGIAATAFGVALDFATGPIGITLGALAALGIAAHIFGDKAEGAAIDTSKLATAFADASTSGVDFASTFTGLNKSVDDFLKAQLAIGDPGQRGIDAANRLGVSIAQIRGALTGSASDFDTFLKSLHLMDDGNKATQKSSSALYDAIRVAGNTLADQAHLAIGTAQSTGLLSAAQIKAAIAAHTARDGNVDWVDTLRELTPAIDAATIAANAHATQVATISPAYRDLVTQFAAGKISIDTFKSSLEQFGFVGQGVADEAQRISDSIKSIVSTTTGALPTASNAISDYASTVKKDLDAVNQAMQSHKGNAHDLFATLVADSDPAKFTENLKAQAQAITDFESNLEKVARVAPELAIKLGQAGPVAAGQLAAGFASDASKAKMAEAGAGLVDAATSRLTAGANNRAAAFEAAGGVAGRGFTKGAQAAVEAGGNEIGAKVEGIAASISTHFHPNLAGVVDDATRAAAVALAQDQTVSQAAGAKALEIVRSFAGQLTPAEAIRVALGQAHDTLQGDQSVPGAAGSKGKQTADAFKPDVASAASKAFATGAATIQTLTSTAVAAGRVGFATGIAFDSGLVEGLAQDISKVASQAAAVAGAAAQAAKDKLKVKSPSQVAVGIGQDFTKGLALGLVDATDQTGAAAKQVADDLVAKLQKELADGIAKVAAQTTASSALSAFASSATSHLPTIGADISSFSSTVASDLATQQQALDAVHKAYAQYGKDQAEVARLTKATDAALAAAVNGTQAQKNAAQALQQQLTQAKNALLADQGQIAGAAKTLSDAQKALAHASDPATFISNLNKQTQASQAFLEDIRKLKAEGDIQLAKELLQAGPDVAGKLADAFAGNAGKAKQANAAIVAADTFAASFTKQIAALFAGPAVQKVASAAGQTIGLGVNTGLAGVLKFNPSAANKLTVPSLAAPLDRQVLPTFAGGGVQTLALDLTINTEDGRTLKAAISIPVPPPGASLVQQTRAQVKAL